MKATSLLLVASLCSACTEQTDDASSCSSHASLPGASYDIDKSHFAFGSTPAREHTGDLIRFVGSHGVVAISPAQAEGGVVIHHSSAGSEPPFQVATTYEIVQGASMGSILEFDENGDPVDAIW